MNYEISDLIYCIELLETGVLDWRKMVTLADNEIENSQTPSAWICDISLSTNASSMVRGLRTHIAEVKYEFEWPKDITQFHIACLYELYLSKKITFLEFTTRSGRYLDGHDDWKDCSYMYSYSNKLESGDIEFALREQCEREFELIKWAACVNAKLSIFV